MTFQEYLDSLSDEQKQLLSDAVKELEEYSFVNTWETFNETSRQNAISDSTDD